MTNAQMLIEAAWTRSTFNDRKIATKAELIGVIDRKMKNLFSIAARENPEYFGSFEDVAYNAAANVMGWPRPAMAEMVTEAYYAAALTTEVHIVPFSDKFGEITPRIYEYGQIYRSVGATGDPVAETIRFYFAARHPNLDSTQPPDAVVNQLSPLWPEQFNDIIILEVSRYLAIKDQRTDEAAVHMAEAEPMMKLFLDHLAHENHGKVSRWDDSPRVA